jgi:hypothetical protein
MFGFHLIKGITFHRLNVLRHQNIPCRSLDMLGPYFKTCRPVESKSSPVCNSPQDTAVFGRSCGDDVVSSNSTASYRHRDVTLHIS